MDLRTWEKVIQLIILSMAVENLFLVMTRNIETDCIMCAMDALNILQLDNNHQELYNKVS